MSVTPYLGLEEIIGDKAAAAKGAVAEFLGTLLLVFIGCGSCMGGDSNEDSVLSDQANYVRIALCFGITVATLAQTLGHVSGCHVNPAVTAGLIIGQKVGVCKGLLFLVCQCAGAVVGAAVLYGVVPESVRGRDSLGCTGVSPGISVGQGFGIEFMITLVLVMVVFASAADANNKDNVKGSAPLAIGLSITTCHLFAIPLTGSSMNPARSLGPSVVMGCWDNHWVYWAGPILGGISAGLLYQLVFQAAPSHTYKGVDKEEMENKV